MSDWSQRPLSAVQCEYAVADACVAMNIYEAISHELADMKGSFNAAAYLQNMRK